MCQLLGLCVYYMQINDALLTNVYVYKSIICINNIIANRYKRPLSASAATYRATREKRRRGSGC